LLPDTALFLHDATRAAHTILILPAAIANPKFIGPTKPKTAEEATLLAEQTFPFNMDPGHASG
jgi:hypothetical protein